jgi:hypothetical protein
MPRSSAVRLLSARRTLLPSLLLPLLASGCGAILATVRTTAASAAWAEAAASDAEVKAPFESRMALRAIEKANEEQADGQYKSAMTLAKSAETWAKEAKLVADGGRRSIDASTGDDLTDKARPAGTGTFVPEPEDPPDPLDPGDEINLDDLGIGTPSTKPKPEKKPPRDDEEDDEDEIDFLEEDDDEFMAPRPGGDR